MSELQRLVAQSADAVDDHATVPTLLMELQGRLGALAALASTATERGRRPFRTPPEWGALIGELAYSIYLLADQTGTDLDAALGELLANRTDSTQDPPAAPAGDWFGTG